MKGGTYQLKMVGASDKVSLAATLWKIEWTTYDNTTKKYYFTFRSAYNNLPLSFSTENAGKDGLSADITYEFPG